MWVSILLAGPTKAPSRWKPSAPLKWKLHIEAKSPLFDRRAHESPTQQLLSPLEETSLLWEVWKRELEPEWSSICHRLGQPGLWVGSGNRSRTLRRARQQGMLQALRDRTERNHVIVPTSKFSQL
ncbi:hypothetical protein PIB30_058567 [Stylosanthes scabra]|uniref:Uncharacterized protein n=1 Tax=Stylosanthes scabra TaxID=79078 RepID=A0ABU6ZIS5_9FABA|nr:hypothetical protein [Stylosanthes scabra]